MNNTTALYQTYMAAEAAFVADELSIAKMDVADAAFAAYGKAKDAARRKWEALPEGDAKDSAEQNAHDTEGCFEDKLRWYEIALGTYEEMISL